MLIKADMYAAGDGGISIIDDFTSVECVDVYTASSSIVPIVFSNVPNTQDAVYIVNGGSKVVGQSYDLVSGETLNDGIIIIKNGNVIYSTSGYGKFTLSGNTLTSTDSGRNVSFGLFKINN